jgi:phenylacetate-CoA ligase
MLRKIVGRDTDIVKTRSGRMLIVHFFTGILEHFPAIKQFRIVQKNIDGFILEYIPEPDLFEMKILEDVQEIIESKINEKVKIEFLKVDEIKPTASGKPQIIKSLLK